MSVPYSGLGRCIVNVAIVLSPKLPRQTRDEDGAIDLLDPFPKYYPKQNMLGQKYYVYGQDAHPRVQRTVPKPLVSLQYWWHQSFLLLHLFRLAVGLHGTLNERSLPPLSEPFLHLIWLFQPSLSFITFQTPSFHFPLHSFHFLSYILSLFKLLPFIILLPFVFLCFITSPTPSFYYTLLSFHFPFVFLSFITPPTPSLHFSFL